MAKTTTRTINLDQTGLLISKALDLVRALQSAQRSASRGAPLTLYQLADIDRYTSSDGLTWVGANVLIDAPEDESDVDVRIAGQ